MPPINFSPAADRNKQPILNVLRDALPERGTALEIASGTGQHVAWFAAALPQWTWQPTDAMPVAMESISAHVAEQGLGNVRPPLVLDVMASVWLPGDAKFDLIYCANMLHISPWATCAALMQGAALHLAPGGVLVTYGPYLEDGVPTSEGNLSFDQSLRTQDPAWGIRRKEDVAQEAARAGLRLRARHAMPANNLLLVWEKQPSTDRASAPTG
jgi:SAM-dependent methyltransferase